MALNWGPSLLMTEKVMMFIRLIVLFLAVLVAAPRAEAATVSIVASKDNTIFENFPNNSAGGAAGIFSGTNTVPSKRRGLIAFDVAANVPAGSTITGVELSMYLANAPNTNNQTIGLHRMRLLDWGEGTAGVGNPAVNGTGNGFASSGNDATWDDRFAGTSSWPTPGATGSFNTVASGTAVVGGATDIQQKWLTTPALVGDVQTWLDSPSLNFGWAIVNANETSSSTFKAFYSRQATLNNGGTGTAIDPAWLPTLTVSYVPEPSAVSVILVGAGMLSMVRRVNRD
jgi:hypothetical protein